MSSFVEKAVERRAREHLRNLVKTGAAGPILPTRSDVVAAGVPDGRVQSVLDAILELRTARDGGDQRTLYRAEELAKDWAANWGDEVRPPDHSGEVTKLIESIGGRL